MLKKFNFGAFQYRSLNPGSCKNFGYFGSAKSNFHYALILEYLAFNEKLKDKLYFLVLIERKKQNKNKSKTKQNFFQIGFVFEVERV